MLETAILEAGDPNAPRYATELVRREKVRPTEQINEGRMKSLASKIQREGLWTKPILVEASKMAIMDGHHRFHAASLLGLSKLPCLILTYDDPNLRVVGWAGGAPYDHVRILEAAVSGEMLAFKTTKHSFSGDVAFSNLPLEALR
ncbi:ParB N-terminal domain-containing protein [Roseovarius aestuarii]|nr:ParB N-terminal domain-containing protein [Roseovarius aestuarii]